jgi:hypothetical protein
VQDILPSDKITELSEAFKHYKEESLNAMKNSLAKKTVGTIRMFKASLNFNFCEIKGLKLNSF